MNNKSNNDEESGAAKESRRLRKLALEELASARRHAANVRKEAIEMAADIARQKAETDAQRCRQQAPPTKSEPATPHTPSTRDTPIGTMSVTTGVGVPTTIAHSAETRTIPYRLSVKMITRNHSIVAASAYRSATRLEDDRYGIVHDYTNKSGVIFSEILVPTTAPDWMKDRATLWNNVERAEVRTDSQLAREMILSIPYELYEKSKSAEDAINLIRRFCLSMTDIGMVVDWCLHRPATGNDPRNIHAHLLMTTRRIDNNAPYGFGSKAREWNDRSMIQWWRSDWSHRVNRALSDANVNGRVSEKSYAERGIDKIAGPKLGPWLARKVQRAFQLIRSGSPVAGQEMLSELSIRYVLISDYLNAMLHNIRIDELGIITEALESNHKQQSEELQRSQSTSTPPLPAGSQALRARFLGKALYSCSSPESPPTKHAHATQKIVQEPQ